MRSLRFRMLGLMALLGGLTGACTPGSSTSTTDNTGGAGGSGGAPVTTTHGQGGTGAGDMGGAGGTGGQGGSGGAPVMSLCPPDADGDDLSDEVEGNGAVDTDGDSIPDSLDLDSDGDSIPDKLEGQTASVGCNAPQDSDNDGTPDYRDADSDNNGLLDRNEVYPNKKLYDPAAPAPNPADTDGDNIPDYADPDNDGDALKDEVELGMNAVDSDGDGLPDIDDTDSDDDTIGDAFEGLSNPDNDAKPAYLDSDSDGDGLSDTCEVGPGHTPTDVPLDTDLDGKYDFLDKDSDGDGLQDNTEDENKSCAADPGETDWQLFDSDADGTSDFIEKVLSSDPLDSAETPDTLGKVYFVLPYMAPAEPPEKVLPLGTKLQRGDVAFFMDTTATMGGEIQQLKTDISSLVTSLHNEIPDVAVGLAGFDDFPTGLYGAVGVDQPFYVAGPKGHVSTAVADNLLAVLSLNVHDGGDGPESHVAAMHRGLTDTFLIWDTGQLAPTGAPSGRYGSLHFRSDALPILVAVSDAPFHNGRRAMAPATLHDPYSFNDTPPFPTPKIDDLVNALKAKGGRFIGINATNGSRNGTDPYEDMAYLCDQVGSDVPPAAFGGVFCATGLFGTFLAAPDGPITAEAPGGTCRLVFDITSEGAGLSASVVAGVKAILKSIKVDVRAIAIPDGGAVDAVDTFIEKIAVDASGAEDPGEPGVPCIALDAVAQLTDIWQGPKGLVKVQDAVNETALQITPSHKICFQVVPKPNTTYPQTDNAQVFYATIALRGKNGISPAELPLGVPREVAFIVPPSPQ